MSSKKKMWAGLAVIFLSWQSSAKALVGEVWLDNYTSLENAVSSIGSDNVTLIIRTPCNAPNHDFSIPSNIAVRVIKGGKIKIPTNYELTISGNFEAQRLQVFSLELTDPGYNGEVVFGPSSIREVVPQWWGARGDGVADDTGAMQRAIDTLHTDDRPVVVFVPAGTYMVSNLFLPARIRFYGAGRWQTTIMGQSTAVGTMITDRGNAAKIIISDMLLSCNDNGGYSEALKLGYGTYPFGTEGLIERLVIRDVPDGTGLAINGNVGIISDISILYVKKGLVLDGNINHVSRLICNHFTEYGIQNDGINYFFSLELESPGDNSTPFYSEDDVFIHGITVSLADNANLAESLIRFAPDNAVQSYYVDSIKLTTKTNPHYEAVVEHEGLLFGAQAIGASSRDSMVFTNKLPQYTIIDDSFASARSYSIDVMQSVPSTTFTVDNLTQDMTINFKGAVSKVQGLKYKVVNNSAKIVYVKGYSSLKIYLNPDVVYDSSIGVPIRPKCYLEFEYAGIGASTVQGYLSRPVMDVSTINSGKWWQGEIVYQRTSLIGSTNIMGKICVTSGDYSGTPPVWKNMPVN